MSEIQTLKPKRSGYIDVIKFIFALLILEFHMGTGLFPGSRVAVEGFFMISAYLMMKNIEKNKFPEDSLGVSTARFISNKYMALFPYLLPAVLISFVLRCIVNEMSAEDISSRIPMLLYEIIPLHAVRFRGEYVIVISWYLSAMFISLAILYPLCKKFKETMTLVVCPVLSVLIYGMFSNHYGHIAITAEFMPEIPINVGLLRGFAGCALGVFLYEACKVVSAKQVKLGGRIFFTIIEIITFLYYLQTMHVHPKSKYEYTLIFATFVFLLIGISGISFSSVIFNPKWSKPLGTASTVLVLAHGALVSCFKIRYGEDVLLTDKVWIFLAVCIVLCIIVWVLGKLIQLLIKNAHKLKLFENV